MLHDYFGMLNFKKQLLEFFSPVSDVSVVLSRCMLTDALAGCQSAAVHLCHGLSAR